MTRRAFRVLLFLGLLGTAALAGYQGWRLETARVRQLASANAFDALTLRLAQAVVDLRASERAYVSSGQGFAYWKPHVDALLQQIRQDLTTLKSSPATPAGADAAVDAAIEALSESMRLEKRIADAAEAGRIQFAADLVYADGLQASLALERAVDTAILAAKSDLAAYQRDARIQELLLAAESACIGLFLALMWFPSQKRPAAAASASAASEPARSATTSTLGLDLPLKIDTSSGVPASAATTSPNAAQSPTAAGIKRGSAAAAAEESRRDAAVAAAGAKRDAAAGGSGQAAREAAAGAAARRDAAAVGSAAGKSARVEAPAIPIASPPPPAPGPDNAVRDSLMAAADLCTSLARVTDSGELAGLVAQMSRQLDAAGVIVWLVDPQGLSLRPALSHGYPAEALARLGRLELTSDNATARAFRLVRPQTVAAKDASPGAIVVPITNGAGCVGAVAAELRHGREQDAGTLALARIFAAQLASLTGPAASGQAGATAGSAASQS